MRTCCSTRAVGLFVLLGAALVLSGPRLDGAGEVLRHPLAWAVAVGPDQAALTVAGLLCWLVLGWLAAGLALMTVAGVPGLTGHVAEAMACRLLPGSVRRIAAGVLGLSLTASVAACGSSSAGGSIGPELPSAGPPAGLTLPAAPGSSDRGVDWPLGTPVAGGPPITRPPAGGPSPGSSSRDRPADEPADKPADGPTGGAAGQGQAAPGRQRRPGRIAVTFGDCLWSIAARHLRPDATAAQVAAETTRWYAANAAVIGPDPDLLRPGQVLTAPVGRP
jgi:hypothetical protein